MGARLPLNNNTYVYLKSDNTKQELMKKLIEQTMLAGHQLSHDEASRIPEMYQPNCYAFYYGSFSEAARIAWSMTMVNTMPERQKKVINHINHNTTQTAKHEVKPYAPPLEPKKPGRKPQFNKEKIIELLLKYYDKNGRFPSQIEAMGDPTLPSWTTILRFLGPKSNWGDHFTVPSKEQASLVDDSARQPEKPISSAKEEVMVEASRHKKGDMDVIELKITLPDRTKPILVTLTV